MAGVTSASLGIINNNKKLKISCFNVHLLIRIIINSKLKISKYTKKITKDSTFSTSSQVTKSVSSLYIAFSATVFRDSISARAEQPNKPWVRGCSTTFTDTCSFHPTYPATLVSLLVHLVSFLATLHAADVSDFQAARLFFPNIRRRLEPGPFSPRGVGISRDIRRISPASTHRISRDSTQSVPHRSTCPQNISLAIWPCEAWRPPVNVWQNESATY